MTLTNKELLEFAKTQNPKAKLHLDCSFTWLAAQAATQLSGKEHKMAGWKKFENWDVCEASPYTEVTPEYAEWSEEVNKHNMENKTYITYQDAVEALESFN